MTTNIYNRAASLSDDVEGFFDGLIKGLVKHDVLHKLIQSIKDDLSAKIHEHHVHVNDRLNRLTTRLENIEFNMAVKDNTMKIIKERCDRLEKKFFGGGSKESKDEKMIRGGEKKKKNGATAVETKVKNETDDAAATQQLVCTCADKRGVQQKEGSSAPPPPAFRREKSVIVTSSNATHHGKVRKDSVNRVRKNSKGSRKSCELRTKNGKKGLVFISSSAKKISLNKTIRVENKEDRIVKNNADPPLPPKKKETHGYHDSGACSSKGSSPGVSPKRSIPTPITRKPAQAVQAVPPVQPVQPVEPVQPEQTGIQAHTTSCESVNLEKKSRKHDSGLSDLSSPTHASGKPLDYRTKKDSIDSQAKSSSDEDGAKQPAPKDCLYPLRQSKLSMTLSRVRTEHEQNRMESMKTAVATEASKKEETIENHSGVSGVDVKKDSDEEKIRNTDDENIQIAEECQIISTQNLLDVVQSEILSSSSLENLRVDVSPSGESCGDSGCPDDEIKQEHEKEGAKMNTILNHRKRSYSECGDLNRTPKSYIHEGPYDDLVDIDPSYPDNIIHCNVYKNIDREFKHIDDTIKRRSFNSSSESKSSGSCHSDNSINTKQGKAQNAREMTAPSFVCSEFMRREKSTLNGDNIRRKKKSNLNEVYNDDCDTIQCKRNPNKKINAGDTNHVKVNSGNKVICDIIIHKKKTSGSSSSEKKKTCDDHSPLNCDTIHHRKKKSSIDIQEAQTRDNSKITIQYKKNSSIEKYGIDTAAKDYYSENMHSSEDYRDNVHSSNCNTVRRKKISKNWEPTYDKNEARIAVHNTGCDYATVSRRKKKQSENSTSNQNQQLISDHKQKTCDTIRYKKDSKTIECSPPCEINFGESNLYDLNLNNSDNKRHRRTVTNCNELQYRDNSMNNNMINSTQFQDNIIEPDAYQYQFQEDMRAREQEDMSSQDQEVMRSRGQEYTRARGQEDMINYDQHQNNYPFQDEEYQQNLNNKLEYFDEFSQDHENMQPNINCNGINIDHMEQQHFLFDLNYQNEQLNNDNLNELNHDSIAVGRNNYINNDSNMMAGLLPPFEDDEEEEGFPNGINYEPIFFDNLARRNESPLSLYKNSDDGLQFPTTLDHLTESINETYTNAQETRINCDESGFHPSSDDSVFHQPPTLSKSEFDNLYRLTAIDVGASPDDYQYQPKINKDGNLNKDGSGAANVEDSKNIAAKYLDLQVRKNLRAPIKNALKDFVYREMHYKEKECTVFNTDLHASLEYLRNLDMSYSDDCDVYGFNSSVRIYFLLFHFRGR